MSVGRKPNRHLGGRRIDLDARPGGPPLRRDEGTVVAGYGNIE